MITRILLLFALVLGVFWLIKKRFKSTNLTTTLVSILLIIGCAIAGLNMRAVHFYFYIHYFTVLIATAALIYYLITKKYIWFLVALPLFSLLFYILMAYILGLKEHIIFG